MINPPRKDEIAQLRKVCGLLATRKWHAAYTAVDQLLYLRERAIEGCAATYVSRPATVTSLLEHRLKLSIARAKARRGEPCQ